MAKVEEVLAELGVERARLVAELARVDRVIEVLQEKAAGIAAETPERVEQTPSVRTAPLPAGGGPYSLLDIYQATALSRRSTSRRARRRSPMRCAPAGSRRGHRIS